MSQARSRPLVAFVSYTGDWTGPTHSLSLLLEHLPDRFEVEVLVPGDGGFTRRLDELGVRAHLLGRLDKWSLPRLVRWLVSKRPSVLYANNTHSSSRVSSFAARLTGTPFVCHVRGMGWDKSRRKLGFLGSADAVIAVSAASAASVERFVDRERLHVVHNGVNLAEYSTPAPPADVDTSVPSAPVILSNGHLMPRKAQLEAVRAFSRVAAVVPDVELWCVGATDRDPAYVDLLEEEVRRGNLGSSVRFLGFRRDIPSLLARSSVCLHTARSEAHGRAIVEAMAAGVPTVAFASGGPEESIEHGKTGFVVPFGDIDLLADFMLRLLRDEALRGRMAGAARQRAQNHFSAAATAERIDRILQDIVPGESASR